MKTCMSFETFWKTVFSEENESFISLLFYSVTSVKKTLGNYYFFRCIGRSDTQLFTANTC